MNTIAHRDNPVPQEEHSAELNLVPEPQATHVAIAGGV